MKGKTLVFSLVFFSIHCQGKILDSCSIDSYFRSTNEYKQYRLEEKANQLRDKENDLSLLPSIYLGTGQYTSNHSSFQEITDSSLHLSVYSNIYSGNTYGKTKERLKIEREISKISVHEKRNVFMINLFKALLELKYLKDQLIVYDKLMPYQDNISQKAEIDYANGNISEMDLSISNLKKEKFKNVMIKLGHDIKLKKEQINIDFNIPEDVIDNIELHDFLSCKSATSVSLLKKKYIEKDKEIKMDNEISKASTMPSVSLSLSMNPPGNGSIRDVNLRNADYTISVDVNIPLSSVFLSGIIDQKSYIDSSISYLKRDDELKSIKKIKLDLLNKISTTNEELIYLSKDAEIKKRRFDYIFSRYQRKEDTIQSLYSQFEQYISSEIDLKKMENEFEYYKVYLSFVDD
ncbi:TolC family protein [Escherichia coli]|nr:TolC family protein [Escherichia coli]